MVFICFHIESNKNPNEVVHNFPVYFTNCTQDWAVFFYSKCNSDARYRRFNELFVFLSLGVFRCFMFLSFPHSFFLSCHFVHSVSRSPALSLILLRVCECLVCIGCGGSHFACVDMRQNRLNNTCEIDIDVIEWYCIYRNLHLYEMPNEYLSNKKKE